MSKSFEGQTDKTEEWYGTQYKQEAINDVTIEVNHCGHSALIKSHTILEIFFFCFVLSVWLLLLLCCLYACVSELGKCRPQRQVQITYEKRVHPYQLRDLPSWERLSVSPHFNQGRCFCSAALSSKVITQLHWTILPAYCEKSLFCFHMVIRYCDWDIIYIVVLFPLCQDQRN